jgi:hypothetical protein
MKCKARSCYGEIYDIGMFLGEICLKSADLLYCFSAFLNFVHHDELISVAEQQLPALTDRQILNNVLASLD